MRTWHSALAKAVRHDTSIRTLHLSSPKRYAQGTGRAIAGVRRKLRCRLFKSPRRRTQFHPTSNSRSLTSRESIPYFFPRNQLLSRSRKKRPLPPDHCSQQSNLLYTECLVGVFHVEPKAIHSRKHRHADSHRARCTASAAIDLYRSACRCRQRQTVYSLPPPPTLSSPLLAAS